MTYIQALIRSLIVGSILSISMLPVVNLMRADYHLINQLAEYLVFILNGYSYLMIINDTKLSLLEICIYPTILCLLLGNIIFWVLRSKQWLTKTKFIFILIGSYLLINIIVFDPIVFIKLINIIKWKC